MSTDHILFQAREWQRIKLVLASKYGGMAEGDQALADSKKIRMLADEIERLQRICTLAHDEILAGAPDAELLAILEGAWNVPSKNEDCTREFPSLRRKIRQHKPRSCGLCQRLCRPRA